MRKSTRTSNCSLHSSNVQIKRSRPKIAGRFQSGFMAVLMITGILFSGNLFAQYSNVPVTGFNADVVADGTAGVDASSSTTDNVDGSGTGANYVFVSTTFRPSAAAAACSPSNAWPATLTSTNVTNNTGIAYNFQSATSNNSLRLVSAASGSLALTTPVSASSLYLVCLGGNGATAFTAKVNFSDGSFENVTSSAPDWCGGAATYKLTSSIYYRITRTATTCTGTTCQYLYEIPVPISAVNYSKAINSITLTNTGGSTVYLHVLAVGRRAVCVTPADGPTGLIQGTTTTSSIQASWTAANSAPTGYLTVAYPSGASPVLPVAGTTYAAGQNLGTGKIIQVSAALSATAGGLNGGTTYDFYVYSYNSGTTCGGPVYNTANAVSGSFATTPCGGLVGGTYMVGPTAPLSPAGFTTISSALTYINSNGITGSVILELQSNYSSALETYPIAFPNNPCIGGVNNLTIRPASGAIGLSISSLSTTGTINFNGGSFITIDGRPGGVGTTSQLTISNTNAGASYAVQFVNEASNNTIKYCTIQSKNTSAASGTVVFGNTTGSNGNDNNTITFCDIRDDASTALNGIYASGSTTTTLQYNDNNVISNNNIYNFFSAASASNGILVSTGNSGWSITGNSFYQTAARTYTTANTHAAININSTTAGNAFIVSGNFIGGTAPNAGGTPYTMLGTVGTLFRGIIIGTAATVSSGVQGNTITNIAFTTSSASTTLPGIFSGINVTAGLVNIGTTSGNIIGATTGNGAITITSTTSGGYITGINASSGAAVTIQNNNIGSVNASGAAAIGYSIYAVYVAGAGNYTISLNIIGSSSTTNSISCGVNATTTATCNFYGVYSGATSATLIMSSNTVANCSVFTTGSTTIYGIYSSAAVTNLAINGNVIRDIKSSGGSGTIYCLAASTAIYTVNSNQVYNIGFTTNSGSSSSVIYGYYNFGLPTSETMTNNQFYNFSIAGASTSSGNSIVGIYTYTTAGTKSWSLNNIYNLQFTNTSTGSASIFGIQTNASSPDIFKNKIYGLAATNGVSSVVYGIYVTGGTTVQLYNNLIGGLTAPASSLPAPAPSLAGIYLNAGTTVNVYYNTVALGGSGGTNFGTAGLYANTAVTSINMRNNIFSSAATPSGTGKSVAYQRSGTGLTNYAATSNNNLFYAGPSGVNNLLLYDGTNALQTIGTFKAFVSPRDAASVSENPSYASTTGANANFLHINTATATQIESGGAAIAGFGDDYDGDTRNASTPDIGADEFTGVIAVVVAINGVTISPSGNQCTPVSRAVTANITAGNSNITSVTLNYSFNGVAQPSITMTGGNPASGQTSTWTGTIPAAGSGVSVTWNVSATDALTTKSAAGTGYSDDPLSGASASVIASPSTPVCAGSNVTLTTILAKPGNQLVGAGASSTTGSGSSSTVYISPFTHYYGGYKSQYIIKASELTALGFLPGNFTRLAFNVTAAGITYNSFTISLANTSSTVASSTFLTGTFTQVFSGNYTPAVGTNDIIFTTPFTWDGTSNMLINLCWSNANGGGTAAEVKYDVTPFVSTAYYRVDSQTPAVVCGQASATGTQSNRPQIRLTGNLALPISSVSWSNGTTTVGSTNPITVNPSITTTYSATITYSGCPINSPSVTVTTIDLPAPPTANNSTQCGNGVPAAFVGSGFNSGTVANFKWYDAQTSGTLLQTGGASFTGSITTTTSFWVSESNGTCESIRTQVIAAVNPPDLVQAAADNSNICLNSSVNLSAAKTTFINSNVYTYSWTASPVSGSGLPSATPGNPISVTPTAAGTYIYTVTATDANQGCVTTSNKTVVIKGLPTINSITATPSAICSGLTSTLAATSVVQGVGTVAIGAGASTQAGYVTTGNEGFGNPYNYWYGNQRTQYIYTQSEMAAAGLSAGNITALSFQTTALGATPYSMTGFNISLGTTAQTAATSTLITSGLVSVYSNASQPITLGINNYNFTTPFNWNGTSNLVVTVCWGNATSGSNADVATVKYDVAPFISTRIIYSDGTVSGGICAATTGSRNDLVSTRPRIVFTGVTAVNNTGSLSWVWNPGSLPGNTVTVSPTTTTIYTVKATDATTTCSATNTVTVTVYELPPAPSGTGSEHCGSQVPTASVSSNSGATTPSFKWYTVATGGTVVQTGTSTTYNSPVSVTTDFYVSEISLNGCEGPRVPVTVSVITADPVTAGAAPASVCIGSSTDLSVIHSGDNNSYNYTWTAVPASGSGIPVSTPGSEVTPVTITPTSTGSYAYTVNAEDPDKGCVTSSTVTVTVNALPVITSATASPSTICAGQSSTLTAIGTPQYTNVPVTGYNIDVVANGVGSVASSTTGTFDNSQYTLAASNWNYTGSCAAIPFYMPVSGTVSANNTVAPGLVYTLQPYTANNDLRIPATGSLTTGTGTLTVTTPVSMSKVFLLYGAGNGPITSGITVTVTFTDATTQVFSNLTAADWYATTNPAISNLGRVDRTATPACATTVTSGPQLFDLTLAISTSNYTKLVQSITINKTITTGTMNIMAVGRETPPTQTLNWVWNPGALTGSTVTVTPTTTTSYTATGTNPVTGCSANSSPVTVTVNPLAAAPVGTNSTQCGQGIPTASVASGGANGTGIFNWYSASSGGTALQSSTSATYNTLISSTTTFYVSEGGNSGCEGPRTAVIVTVTTPAAISTSSSGPASVCLGSPVTLAASSSATYTYTWTASPVPGSGIPTSAAGSPVSITPTATGTYIYTVTGVDNSGATACTTTATFTATVNPNPVIDSVRANPSTTCAGGSVMLNAYSYSISSGPQTLPAYAAPGTTTSTSSDNITLVNFNSINNATTTAGSNGFADYTATITAPTITSGNSYTLTVNVNNGGTEYAGAWFDWNRNGVYDASEFYNIPLTLATTWNGSITVSVPSNAVAGKIGLRVRCRFNAALANTDAYSAYTYGETEEYALNLLALVRNANYTYSWNTNPVQSGLGLYTITVMPTATTTYTVVVSNPATGCASAAANTSVTVTPVVANATASPSTAVCAGTSVTLNGNPTGGAPFTYSWSNGTSVVGTTNPLSVTPTTTTNYTVTVTDACGNITTSTVTVNVNALPIVTVTPVSASVCQPGATPVTLTAGGASTYTWTPAAGLSAATGAIVNASPVLTTTYTVSGTNGNGCVNTATATITVLAAVTNPTASATPATQCEGGQLNLASSASIAGYTLNPNSGVAFIDISTSGTSVGTISDDSEHPLTIPSFTFNGVVYTNARVGNNGVLVFGATAGDINYSNRALPAPLGPNNLDQATGGLMTNVTGSALTAVCAMWDDMTPSTVVTTSITTQTVGNKYIVQWTNEDAFSATGNGTITFQIQLDLVTGQIHLVYPDVTYGVAGYDGGGSATIGLNFSATSALQYSNLTSSLTDGQSLTFTPNAITYAWTGPNGFTSALQNPTISNATTAASGVYTVSFTSGAGCTNTASTAIVTVNPRPTGVLSGSGTYCAGQGSTATTLSIAVTGAGPWTGTITDGTSTIPFSGSASPISVSVTPTATTTYTIATLNGSACSSIAADLSGSATITVNPTPATPTVTAGGPTTFCSGGSVVLTSSSATGNQWNLNGTAISGATNQTLTVAASGDYTVTVTNASNCSATSTVTTVTVNPTPATPTVTAGGPTTFCQGGSVVLTSSATTGNQWNLNGTAIAGATNQTLTVTASGNYTITVTAGSCSATSAVTTVTVNPTPATPTVTSGGPTTFCSGGSVVLTSSSATGNQWNLNGTAIAGATNQTLTVTASGDYTVTVTNGSNCAATSTITTVTVNPTPATPTVTAGGPTTFCSGGSVVLTSSSATGNQWNLNGTAIAGATNQTLTVTASGDYTVTVTAGTCSATSTVTTVTVNPTPATPTVTAGGQTTFCSGGSVVLTSSSATGNQWNLNGTAIGGATNQTLTVTASGDYTVTVTNGSNCSATSTITTVTVNPTPATPTVTAGGPTTFCQGGSVVLTSSSATGNQWNLNGTAIVGATNQTLTVTASGNYTVTVTAGSCSATSTATTVTVNPLAANVTATVTQPTCTVATGTVTVTAPLGAGITYSLDGGAYQPGTTFSNVAPGTHTLTAQTVSGCFSPASTSVTVNAQPVTPAAPVVSGIVNVCPYLGTGQQLTYTATAAGATGFTWTLPPHVNLVTGQGTSTLVVTFDSALVNQVNKQLRVKAVSSCGSSAIVIFYLTTQIPAAPAPISGIVNICPYIGTGTVVTYTIPSALSATRYLWSVPAGTTVTHPNIVNPADSIYDTVINVVYNAGFVTGGGVSISVTSRNGCGLSGTRTLQLSAQPAATPGLINGPTNVCANILPGGTAATYSVSPVSGAVSYTWTWPSGATVSYPNGQGVNGYTISVLYPQGFNSGTMTVSATNGCGTGGVRSLSVTKLTPSTPSNIDVIQTGFCGDVQGRVYTYTLSSMPANATSVQWTIPATGATFVSGQGTTSITVSYGNGAVNGNITAQAQNNCGVSGTRSVIVKLPVCSAAGFAGKVQVKEVTAQRGSMEVKIFPNPTVSDFKLEVLSSSKDEVEVRVIDVEGRLYKSFKTAANQTISLGAELKAGSYMVEVRQGGELRTTKLVKF